MVFSYPIHEYWLDIGKIEDFVKAGNEYKKVFLKMKKSLIIGYGSVGKKHEKILNKIGLETHIYSRRNLKTIVSFQNLSHAIEKVKPDYIIVANETSEHLKTLNILEQYNIKKILVEKPIFDNLDHNLKFNDTQIFVGYNLRYHPLIAKLKEYLKKQKILLVDIKVGFPTSLIGEKDRDYFKAILAQKKLGGGVLRDLSHEIDYFLWIFGGVRELVSVGGHFSSLSGDSDDFFKILLKMDKCNAVSISLDYLNRLNQREITVITQHQTIQIDLKKYLILKQCK